MRDRNGSSHRQQYVRVSPAKSVTKPDYDLGLTVSPLDVTVYIEAVDLAFRSWGRVREQPDARDYLFSLLFRDR